MPEAPETALRYPPVPSAFLRLFGETDTTRVVWIDEALGRFLVRVGGGGVASSPVDDSCVVPLLTASAAATPSMDTVFETPSMVDIPEIPAEKRCREPPQ